ncbi:hypothetical protein Mmc1_0412 [Magnetococcus marinus MC-1]|uniref:Uncharacterized protein n=1 Tax=Magnetococcus marinus (strain ATCC BAA-1437 / JCM 17883 / MC-1) TaxID=156889 RepID=A0L4P5_MAGMM|nr:hypothetical protein [Magnetococcus marinus]ABK42938.1 hypothetical protein Mmc1_0412 [Magnetococcus marinus MC-1]
MAKKKKKGAKEKLLSAAKRLKQEERARKKLMQATKQLKDQKKASAREDAPSGRGAIRVAQHLLTTPQPEPPRQPPPPVQASVPTLKEITPEILDLDRLHILGQILDYAIAHNFLDEETVLRWGKRCVNDPMLAKLNLTVHDEKLPPTKPIRLKPNLYGG